MSRYIDADKLKKSIPMYHGEYPIMMKAVRLAIDAAPTADVVEVRHGKWKWLGPNLLNRETLCGTCSVCKVRSKYIVNETLCPNCGAKMDGERREE